MADARAHAIDRGERAPDFALLRGGGGVVRFYSVAGGAPCVLVMAGELDPEDVLELGRGLRRAVAPHDVHLVTNLPVPSDDGAFHDVERRVHDAYGVPLNAPPVVIVLDPNIRVVGEFAPEAVEEVRAAVQAARHPDAAHEISRQAPVLFVPDVLDRTWCDRLIEHWAASSPQDTGVEVGAGDERAEITDEHRKRRRDHTVTDAGLLRELTEAVGRRLMPEVQRAFAYRASRFEGFKIGCYQAETRGFFDAHRDNLSPATLHRRFALTLNLNDDYDGGQLRFPEFGHERYRPAAGTALVFSGSLLHEVLPVTRGQRFVLLSFLFDRPRRRVAHDHGHDHAR